MHMMRKCFNASLSVKVEKPPGRKFFDDLMKPVHENNLAMLAFCHDADLLRNLYVHNAQWEGNMKVSPGPGVPVFLGKPKIKYVTHILDLSNIWYMYTQHCYMYSSGWLLLYSWKKKKKKRKKRERTRNDGIPFIIVGLRWTDALFATSISQQIGNREYSGFMLILLLLSK